MYERVKDQHAWQLEQGWELSALKEKIDMTQEIGVANRVLDGQMAMGLAGLNGHWPAPTFSTPCFCPFHTLHLLPRISLLLLSSPCFRWVSLSSHLASPPFHFVSLIFSLHLFHFSLLLPRFLSSLTLLLLISCDCTRPYLPYMEGFLSHDRSSLDLGSWLHCVSPSLS